MKTTIENNETKTAAMPFPSQVTSGAPNKQVQDVSSVIVDTSRDLNNLMATAGNVHFFVRSHYVDTKTGVYGIESLISSILKSHGAEFPLGVEFTALRKVAMSASMFASEIISEVQNTFGVDRYPAASIHVYLSDLMKRHGKIGKIKLSSAEDSARQSKKPRIKFYLVEKAN
jgi:hypothetical protein